MPFLKSVSPVELSIFLGIESGLWDEARVNDSFHKFKELAANGQIDFYRLFKVLSEVRADIQDLPSSEKRL